MEENVLNKPKISDEETFKLLSAIRLGIKRLVLKSTLLPDSPEARVLLVELNRSKNALVSLMLKVGYNAQAEK